MTPKPTHLTATPWGKMKSYYGKPSLVKNGLDGIKSSEVCLLYMTRSMVKKLFYLPSFIVPNTSSFLLDPCVIMLISLVFSTFALFTVGYSDKEKLSPACNERSHLSMIPEILHFGFRLTQTQEP